MVLVFHDYYSCLIAFFFLLSLLFLQCLKLFLYLCNISQVVSAQDTLGYCLDYKDVQELDSVMCCLTIAH